MGRSSSCLGAHPLLAVVCGLALLGAGSRGVRAEPPAVTPPPVSGAGAGSASEPVSDATARLKVSERPWAVGVSDDRQEAALKHLQEGNGLLKESLFVAAAKVYRQALTEWDHPGIHYNLALALLNLDQPVEVYEHLVAAVKYGADPLDPEKLEHARSYLRIIEKQVASLEVTCDVAGAQVTFDGGPLFVAPGRYEGLVRAGTHTITASKDGFAPTSRVETLSYDRKTTLDLKLYTASDLIEYRRRYPIWRPVAITALGAALLATGVVFSVQASNNVSAYDKSAANVCTQMTAPGCGRDNPSYAKLDDLRRHGESYQRVAAIAYVSGGLIAGAGVLLLVLDRSTAYRVDPGGERRDEVAAQARVSPLFAPGFAGLVGTGRF
jgi:hypothetical protein